MTKTLVAAAFLGLNFYIYNFFATDAVIPPRTSFAEFPLEIEDGWWCEPEELEEAVINNLGVTDYLTCEFRNPDRRWIAGVYVGYHETQVREEGGGSGENSIHPPAHCLPGSGWDIIRNETVPLTVEGLPQQGATVKRLIIAKGEARQLVYYWYQSRGRVISEDWKKILYVGYDRATRLRTDGSLVRFSIPVIRENEEQAEEVFQSLAPLLLTRMQDYVPL